MGCVLMSLLCLPPLVKDVPPKEAHRPSSWTSLQVIFSWVWFYFQINRSGEPLLPSHKPNLFSDYLGINWPWCGWWMWRCVLTAVGANPRGVPGCRKGDEHHSICGQAAGEAPRDVGGKRRLARQCCFGQDRLPYSSDVGSFLVSWNALLLHKGSFCFFCVACPKWDSLLLPSRLLFCLLSNLFIQMGLRFVLGAHYPEDKMSPTAKWEHSYIERWRWCTVFPGIVSKCMHT